MCYFKHGNKVGITENSYKKDGTNMKWMGLNELRELSRFL